MTKLQRQAVELMERAANLSRGRENGVSHGQLTYEKTFYDAEINSAYVHWRTARALIRLGIVRYGEADPEYGTELWLTST